MSLGWIDGLGDSLSDYLGFNEVSSSRVPWIRVNVKFDGEAEVLDNSMEDLEHAKRSLKRELSGKNWHFCACKSFMIDGKAWWLKKYSQKSRI